MFCISKMQIILLIYLINVPQSTANFKRFWCFFFKFLLTFFSFPNNFISHILLPWSKGCFFHLRWSCQCKTLLILIIFLDLLTKSSVYLKNGNNEKIEKKIDKTTIQDLFFFSHFIFNFRFSYIRNKQCCWMWNYSCSRFTDIWLQTMPDLSGVKSVNYCVFHLF